MRSEKTIWRFWATALVLLGIVFASLGISGARSYTRFPHGLILLLAGLYLMLAIVILLAARFQIYELRAEEDRWARNDARIRKWGSAALGSWFILGALLVCKRLIPSEADGHSLTSTFVEVAFYLYLGFRFIRYSLRINRAKTA